MKTLNRFLPAILIMIFIYMQSTGPTPVVADSYTADYLSKKLAHVIFYFLLCISFYRGTKSIPLAILLTVFYGITDEMHQLFVPLRSGQLSDVVIDTTAASFAGVILWKFYQNLPKILRNWLEA